MFLQQLKNLIVFSFLIVTFPPVFLIITVPSLLLAIGRKYISQVDSQNKNNDRKIKTVLVTGAPHTKVKYLIIPLNIIVVSMKKSYEWGTSTCLMVPENYV